MPPPPVPTIDSVEVDEALGRVRITGSVGAGTSEYGVYRVGPSGVQAFVRGVVADPIVGPASIDVVDYETPFGVQVDYVLVARNVDGETLSNANRATNGTFEVDASGWSADGGSVARSTTKARTGAASLRLTTTGGLNDAAYTVVESVSPGSTLELELWVNPDVSVVLNLQVNETLVAGGLNRFTEAPPVTCPPGVWTLLDYALELIEDTDDVQVYVTTAGVQPATNIYIDDVEIVVASLLLVDVDADWIVDLDDARNTGPVSVESFSELTYDAPQGVHRVIGRRTPVVTSDVRWTPTGRLVLTTATVDEARRVRDALGSSGPLLLRSTVDRGVGNMYLQPVGVVEQRISRIAFEPSRRWVVDVVEIDRPDPATYTPLSVTWGEVDETFATWADVLAERDSWGDLLYNRDGLVDSELYSREPAFPPRDV